MKEETMFTLKQVGERIKERRIELKLSMPELGKRIGVNKSTIQRYEADGVDPEANYDYQRSCRSTAYHSRMADRSFR